MFHVKLIISTYLFLGASYDFIVQARDTPKKYTNDDKQEAN